jgi:hypothetical protein
LNFMLSFSFDSSLRTVNLNHYKLYKILMVFDRLLNYNGIT